MTFPPEKAPSKPIPEKEAKGVKPFEIAVGISFALCLIAFVVSQIQRFAEHYESAAAVGDGATLLISALMVPAVMGAVIVVGARLILKSEPKGRLERDHDGGGAPTAGQSR